MTLNEILDEVKQSYGSFANIESILDELNHGININHWASQFCTKTYDENFDLAQIMFEYMQNNAKDFRDFKSLAFHVGDPKAYDDQAWAKELINESIKRIEKLRDLVVLADELANTQNSYSDTQTAMILYNEAIEKAQTSYDYFCIAESLCDISLLNDKEWAREVYLKAVEVAQDSDELTYIADSIANEENLDDEEWSNELYTIAQEFEGQKD